MRRSNILRLAIALASTLVTLLFATRAQAIPAFARRYETSCQTCHVAFPKLNPFGEAFRRNGYRFPDDGDETTVKEERVSLGAEANRELWPREVYPGEIASKVPLAVVLDAKATTGRYFESTHLVTTETADHHATTDAPFAPTKAYPLQTKLNEVGGRLLLGGTLGKSVSFLGALSASAHMGVDLERAFVTLLPANATALHLKLGRFEPALHGVSIHRGIFGHQLRLTTTPVMLSLFQPEASLYGAEASGVVAGRVGWYAGLSENASPTAEPMTDVYGRSEVKIGGMRLDGAGFVCATRPWRERSLLLGMSGYRGRSRIRTAVTYYDHDETFVRAGLDAHAVFDDLMLDVVVARQRHDAPGRNLAEPRTLDQGFAELTWVAYAWLLPSARLELSKLRGGAQDENRWLAQLLLTTLVAPNVLLRAEVGLGAEPADVTRFRYAALSLSAGL